MKKYTFLMMGLMFTLMSFSQSLDDINELMDKRKYAAAKTDIDKYLSETKNSGKADGYYFKARIYNSLSHETTISPADAFKLKSEAFDALKKYQSLDANEVRTKLEGFASFLDLYFGFYDLGVNQFNAKNYDDAVASFTKALEIKDFILSKNYTYTQVTLYPLDTALVLNAGTAANLAKKEDQAAAFYKKLTDANVSDKTYMEVYEYLGDYYGRKDNKQELDALIAKARKFYPQNNFWIELDLRALEKAGDQAALFAKYDELIAQQPDNYYLMYSYAVEIYNSLYAKNSKPTNETTLKDKLTSLLKIAIPKDTGIAATVLMSNHLYNIASDYSIASSVIKGNKAEDVKKKNELKSLANAKMDEFLPYADAALKYFESLPKLKTIDKATYRSIAGNISDVYGVKGNPKKAAEYDKKRTAPDKM